MRISFRQVVEGLVKVGEDEAELAVSTMRSRTLSTIAAVISTWPGCGVGIGRMQARRNANIARGLFTQFAEGGQLGFDFFEARAHGAKQAFACFCRSDAACCAGQEPHPQPSFEVADRVA